jgi:methylmalonyl-CoA mutase N-terminal domain/subunit
MTDEVEAAARELMARVEDMGGAVEAIEQGFQKREIEIAAYRVAQQIDEGSRVVVGVNKYTTPEEEAYQPLRVDPSLEAAQAARLEQLRAQRDNAEVTRQLDQLKKAAEGEDNVLYPMRDALRAKATVGEVCSALRAVWGVYQPRDAF